MTIICWSVIKHAVRHVGHFVGRGARHHVFHRPVVRWVCRVTGGGLFTLPPGTPFSGGHAGEVPLSGTHPGTFGAIPGFPEGFMEAFSGAPGSMGEIFGGSPALFGPAEAPFSEVSGLPVTGFPVTGLPAQTESLAPFHEALNSMVPYHPGFPNISEVISQLSNFHEFANSITPTELNPVHGAVPEPMSLLILLSSLVILSISLTLVARGSK